METIRGKESRELGMTEWTERLAGYNQIALDLGTGDGRFALDLARRRPSWFVIGLDACRENLYRPSRTRQPNVLFVIAEAQRLPWELGGLVSHMAINFPWGSLLGSLLRSDPALMTGLAAVSRSHASVDLRLNAGALAEAGSTLETGTDLIHNNLLQAGWTVQAPRTIEAADLRKIPSTWARRLAFGRDPRGLYISAKHVR